MGYRHLLRIAAACAGLSITASAAPAGRNDYETLIERSDLVVHAVILGMSREEVPMQDFMPADPRPDVFLNVRVLELEVREVLKGYYADSKLAAVVPEGLTSLRMNYNVGDEIVLPLIYWKFMRGGSFMVTNDGGRFLKVGDRWIHQLAISGEAPLSLTLDDIRATASRYSPESAFRSADAAAVGIVEDVRSQMDPEGALIEVVRMRVSQGVKGVPRDGVIVFRAVRKGGDELTWKTPVPPFAVGDEWLVYFKRDAQGYYVSDGTNGCFRVEGDALIQADHVRVPMSKPAFIQKVMEVPGND